jgi:hypothetical protein
MNASVSSRPRTRVSAPLFLLGAPRSGTSHLYRCLALHPRAAWISNHCRGLPELAVLNRFAAKAPRTRARVWFGDTGEEASGYEVPHPVAERWFPRPVECDQPRARTDFRRLARAAGGDVLLLKVIAHDVRIPQLAAMFPDARFVAVTRDGRAVARSLLYVDWWPDHPLWWWEGTPIDWASTGHNPVDAAAEHWVREVALIEHGLVGLAPERVRRVSYEDLVTTPHQVLEEVAEFAGLGTDEGWHRALEHVSFLDRNRQVPHDHVYDRATVLQKSMLTAMGYRP